MKDRFKAVYLVLYFGLLTAGMVLSVLLSMAYFAIFPISITLWVKYGWTPKLVRKVSDEINRVVIIYESLRNDKLT